MSMKQFMRELEVRTPGPGLHEVTDKVRLLVDGFELEEGLVTLFVRHTSASLVIQENADPDVCRDLEDFFAGLVRRDAGYRHDAEGPDDMPAHIRAALTQTSLGIPLVKGRMALGTWQGIYLFEHRDRPHDRRLQVHAMGTD